MIYGYMREIFLSLYDNNVRLLYLLDLPDMLMELAQGLQCNVVVVYYTVSQKSVCHLIFYNLKHESVFIIFGTQYPDKAGF